MTREELEKMLEDNVTSMRIYDEYRNEITDEIKNFIFETIITEVLKSVINKSKTFNIHWCDYLDFELVKEEAKEKFWITL